MFKSLRARLAIWHVAMLLSALTAFATLLYIVLSSHLQHHHDDELAEQARVVTNYLKSQTISEAAVLEALRSARVSSRFVMIRSLNGDLEFREPALQATEPNIGRHAVLTHAAMARPTAPEFFTVDLEQSGAVRFICVPLAQANLFLQIGDPIGDVQTTMDAVRRTSVILIPMVLLGLSLGSWLLARGALQPVRQMTAALREIGAHDLGRRVQIEASDPELGGLVASINQLLNRLERAFANLRQFAGDVSHELRTPLTVMKSTIESAQRQARPGFQNELSEIVQQIDSMSATVTGLRALALADSPVHPAPFSLSDTVIESADIVAALAEMKSLRLTTDIAPDIEMVGDATRVRQVVLNLGENAVKFTPAGGVVHITLSRRGATAELTVSDTGPGISELDQARIFDRLFRAGGNDNRQGIGIGLAIVKRIVDAHDGTVIVVSESGAGSRFTVRLPLPSLVH
jgi:signal transduction histidine kinase